MFDVIAFDQSGEKFTLPSVKIGFFGQTTDIATHEKLQREFDKLPKEFFSLGVSVNFYKQLFACFDEQWRREFLESIRDVVWNKDILKSAIGEPVFRTAHLRTVDVEEIQDQFTSVLTGETLLTDFNFGFELPASKHFAGFDLTFKVNANSTPSTNMHALIGRNGVGKT
ncbi:MAG: hypothetical protein C6Y22_29590, partial [Hapalosiphonaceae cyanobacterium JJU2]